MTDQTRTEYAVEAIKKIREEENNELSRDVRSQLSLGESQAIEESRKEFYDEFYDCSIVCGGIPCEECTRYMSSRCRRSGSADDWADGLNNIDDALEIKRGK